MAGTYLELHPNPNKAQHRKPRRAQVTGAIVVHTAESATDLVLPDAGAEGVARFISTRGDAGSYHSVVDSDTIVRVMPYEWEAWHEGTGGNPYSLGLSIATKASLWTSLPLDWVTGALEMAALEAADMAEWVKATTGVVVPAVHITPAEYRAGKPGFIGHGELDPGRRSDPGPAFPWGRFLTRYADLVTGDEVPEPTPTYSLMDLSKTVEELEALYYAYRGYEEAYGQEIMDWSRDLAEKLAKGEDPVPTLNYVQWALAKELADGVAGN